MFQPAAPDDANIEFPPIAQLENEQVIMWNYRAGSILYTKAGFFGKPIGERKVKPEAIQRPFKLSYFDALYLLEKHLIRISHGGSLISEEHLKEIAIRNYENFMYKYEFYKYLRDLLYIIRPGMKFGSDFLVYEKGPGVDHAHAVLHVEDAEKEIKAIQIIRAGRLASSVKKNYIIGVKDDDRLKFYSFSRVKI